MTHATFEEAFAASHEALNAMPNGNPGPTLALWSRRDDAVLANPLGSPKVGFANIAPEAERVAAMFASADGPMKFEEVSRIVTPDLACVIGFERTRARRVGSDEVVEVALRVTTVFRREDDGWKLVLRHADRLAQ